MAKSQRLPPIMYPRTRLCIVSSTETNFNTNLSINYKLTGVGRLHELRSDGIRVVKFPFGMAYMNQKDVQHLPRVSSSEEEDIRGLWEDANERAIYGVELFFNNKFQEAEDFFKTEKHVFPVYALGHAVLSFMKAIMTWEKADLALAQERLLEARVFAEKFAPQEGLVSSAVSG
jgi:hypothetical protein